MLHRCPNCDKKAFTWFMVEESTLTKWMCLECHYIMWEDENDSNTNPLKIGFLH